VVGFGVALVLVGLFLAWNGVGALTFNGNDGRYELTEPVTIEVSSRAAVTNDVELLRGGYGVYSILAPIHKFFSTPDDVRMRGVAAGPESLFMGIAPADAAAEYLDGVVHDEITDWDSFNDHIENVVYSRNEGTTDPAAPGTKGFWVASVSGNGEQALDWTIQSGDWAVVIMNADGSPGVAADVRFGVLAPSGLVAIGWALVVVGLLVAIGGIGLILPLPSRLISSLPSRSD
jgi:hypothetical protein